MLKNEYFPFAIFVCINKAACIDEDILPNKMVDNKGQTFNEFYFHTFSTMRHYVLRKRKEFLN